jgi:hypothetical protein
VERGYVNQGGIVQDFGDDCAPPSHFQLILDFFGQFTKFFKGMVRNQPYGLNRKGDEVFDFGEHFQII